MRLLNETELQRLVEMQQRSFRLLKWMAGAVEDGFVRFDTAHNYTAFPEAAADWITRHYQNIPADARPPHDDLHAFCEFFSTYLKNSFDLKEQPGVRLYSEDAHCFCPICSWLVRAPNLVAKKLRPRDKSRARKLRVQAIERLAAGHEISVTGEQINALLEERETFEEVSMLAYAYDLLQREKGIANGPAVLALWRGFAWTEAGSPKHRFKLTGKQLVEVEQRLLERLRAD